MNRKVRDVGLPINRTRTALICHLQLLFGTTLLDPLVELVNALVPLSAAQAVASVCESDKTSDPSIGSIAQASSRSGDAPTRRLNADAGNGHQVNGAPGDQFNGSPAAARSS